MGLSGFAEKFLPTLWLWKGFKAQAFIAMESRSVDDNTIVASTRERPLARAIRCQAPFPKAWHEAPREAAAAEICLWGRWPERLILAVQSDAAPACRGILGSMPIGAWPHYGVETPFWYSRGSNPSDPTHSYVHGSTHDIRA